MGAFRKRTRMVKATELIDRLNRGPEFDIPPGTYGDASYLTPAARTLLKVEISAQYRSWIDSWVRQDVLDLVPELRSK